ncbi:DUF58 domain-containing protein [Micromonospora sp. NPDC003197]
MPTVRGWTVLAVSTLLLVLGLVVGYRELPVLGGVGLVAVGVAAGWVGWPPRLSVDRTLRPARTHRGGGCQVVLDVHTVSGRTRRFTATDVLDGPAGQQGRDRIVPIPAIRVRGGMPTRLTYPLPTDRRGVFTVGPLRIARTDPLGLCRIQQRVGPSDQLVVRPRWHRLRALPAGIAPNLDGTVDGARHGSIAFHALREYRTGDDLRHVHWRTSARVGELMVREYVDTALPQVVLLLDDRAEAYQGHPELIEEAIEVAASLLVSTLDSGTPVSLHLASARGVAATTSTGLDLLAQVRPVAGVDLAGAVRRTRSDGPRRDAFILVTGSDVDLAPAVAAADGYPQVMVVALGPTTVRPAPPRDVALVSASNAVEFASRWDRPVRWA